MKTLALIVLSFGIFSSFGCSSYSTLTSTNEAWLSRRVGFEDRIYYCSVKNNPVCERARIQGDDSYSNDRLK